MMLDGIFTNLNINPQQINEMRIDFKDHDSEYDNTLNEEFPRVGFSIDRFFKSINNAEVLTLKSKTLILIF